MFIKNNILVKKNKKIDDNLPIMLFIQTLTLITFAKLDNNYKKSKDANSIDVKRKF